MWHYSQNKCTTKFHLEILLSSLINIINQFTVRQTTKGKKEKDKENYQQPIKVNVFIQIVHNKKHILSSFSKALAQYQRVKLQLKVYPKK